MPKKAKAISDTTVGNVRTVITEKDGQRVKTVTNLKTGNSVETQIDGDAHNEMRGEVE